MHSLIYRVGLLACFAVANVACTYLTPYKVEVQQGTVITSENVGKLKPGMTRSQVSFVMGTPLLADAFHADRWDYVYFLRKRDRIVDQRKVALMFEGDTLKDIRSDLPVGKSEAPSPAAPGAASQAPAPAPVAPPAGKQ